MNKIVGIFLNDKGCDISGIVSLAKEVFHRYKNINSFH